MTQAEHTGQIREAEDRFFAWESETANEFANFRCYKQASHPIMNEVMCMARATKPKLYQDTCGGNPRCPRWRHYRKLAKKAKQKQTDDVTRRAYR